MPLQSIIDAASSGDVIEFQPGTYNSDCNLEIRTPNLTLTAGGSPVVIDCIHQQRRCLTIMGVSARVVGIEFRNGAALAGGIGYRNESYGGNVLVMGGENVVFERVVVSGGFAYVGGGMTVMGCLGFYLMDSIFQKNGGYGPNMLFGGGLGIYNSSAVISNSSFLDNYLYAFQGGSSGGGVSINDCAAVSLLGPITISNNMLYSATVESWGAGIVFEGILHLSIVGPITVNGNSILSDGDNNAGGGLVVMDVANFTMTGPVDIFGNSLTANNESGVYGAWAGGMNIGYCEHATITGPISVYNNSIFTKGLFANGGGISIQNIYQSLTFSGPLRVSGNRINATNFNDNYGLWGGGFLVSFSRNVTLLGPIEVSGNSIYSITDNIHGGGLYVQKIENFISITGPTLIYSNVLSCSNGVTAENGLWGAGMMMQYSDAVLIQGPFSVYDNSILSLGDNLHGAGGYFRSIFNTVTIRGSASIYNNSLVSYGSSGLALRGGGLSFEAVNQVALQGSNISISHNRIHAATPNIIPSKEAYLAPRGVLCTPALATISNTRGNLSDGSFPYNYPAGMLCSWSVVSNNDVNRAFGMYQLRFLHLDVFESAACTVDSLSIFDGPTSSFPLIGTYCGDMDSNTVVCSSGMCPPASSIINTTSTAIYIHFVTNKRNMVLYPLRTGFVFEWSLVRSNIQVNVPVSASAVMPTLSDQQCYSAGGGLSFRSCGNVLVDGPCAIHNNVVFHSLLAIGGGIALLTGSKLRMTNASIASNSVQGFMAGGGGLVIMEYSKLSASLTEFALNAAVGTSPSQDQNKCITAFDYVVRCSATFGGGVLVVRSTATVQDQSIVNNNTVSCGEHSRGCTVQGGGLCVTRNSSVVLLNVVGSNNEVECSHSACTAGSGGFLWADSIQVHMNETEVHHNRVVGVGQGGGITASQGVAIDIENSWISANTGQMGAGLRVQDSAKANIVNSVFANNVAESLGGAVSTVGSSMLMVVNSSIYNNTAAVGSAFMTMAASTVFSKVSLLGSAGIFAVIIGPFGQEPKSSLSYYCNNPGSFFSEEQRGGDSYYSLECKTCSQGTYLALQGSSRSAVASCNSCPSVAICDGTSSSSFDFDFGVKTRRNYWGLSSSGIIKFLQCPPGYCCDPTGNHSCPYNYCAGNRVGVLCGQCEEERSLPLFSTNCVPNGECDQARWFLPLCVLMAMIVIAVLIRFWDVLSKVNTNNDTNFAGLVSTLVFFYQASPLVMGGSVSKLVLGSVVIVVLESIFNVSPKSSAVLNFHGICLFPNTTVREKFSYEIGGYGLIYIAMAGVWLLHYLFHLLRRLAAPDLAVYVPLAIKIFTLSYITITTTTLNMLLCFSMVDDGTDRWFYDATIQCFQPWQQVAVAGVVLLSIIPFVIAGFTLKWGHGLNLGRVEATVRSQLVSSYKARRWWWAAVSMGRRLLISIAFAWTPTNGWRIAAMFTIVAAFVGSHLWAGPFASQKLQNFETFCLSVMCLLVALSSKDSGDNSTDDNNSDLGLAVAQLLLFLLPGIIAFLFFAKVCVGHVKSRWFKPKMLATGKEMNVRLLGYIK